MTILAVAMGILGIACSIIEFSLRPRYLQAEVRREIQVAAPRHRKAA